MGRHRLAVWAIYLVVFVALSLGAMQDSARVEIEVRGEYRQISSNGLPNHPTGQFPNRGNPNTIQPQNYNFRVPANPKVAATPTALEFGPFGIALNGLLFDPGTAEFWRDDPNSGWRMEALGGPRNLGLDQNNAHVQPNGAYHYHAIPVGLVEKLGGQKDKPLLLGWAADGFPIYGAMGYSDPKSASGRLKKLASSYRLKKGARPSEPNGPGGNFDGAYTADWEFVKDSGDLDECNGRVGVTPEFPEGIYHYVITDQFPFIPRMFRGTPDDSFRRGGGPGRDGRRGPPPRGRRGPPPPPPR